MCLRGNFSGGKHFVVENHRNNRDVRATVDERTVIPAAALPETRPVRGCSQRRNDDEIRLCERLRPHCLTARLSGRSPERYQRLPRLPEAPARGAVGGAGLVEEDGQERAIEGPERQGQVGLEGGGHEERGQRDSAH